MTIRIHDNRIDFGNYSLAITPKGLSVNSTNSNSTGVFTATSFDYTASPFQGTNAGYTSGGWTPVYNTIDKFKFRLIINSTDVGDLTASRALCAGESSSISGYTSGGYSPPGIGYNTIDKFPFAQNSNAIDVGDLTSVRYTNGGHSSNTSGYTAGGFVPTSGFTITGIDKFPFSNDVNASAVGNLTQARTYGASQCSSTHGYISGGSTQASTPSQTNTIDKFPFASDGTATDVGDMTTSTAFGAGVSSTTWGYNAGAGWGSTPVATVQRFSFITNQNATNVGSLTFGRYGSAGHSYETLGYVSGGFTGPPQTAQNSVEYFSFNIGTNFFAIDVGDLTVARGYAAGTQD
jgi:hypothetical protein